MKFEVNFTQKEKFKMLRGIWQTKVNSKNIAEMERNNILSHLCDQYDYTIRGEEIHSEHYLCKMSSQVFHMAIMRKLLYKTEGIPGLTNALEVLLKYQEFRLGKTKREIKDLYERRIKFDIKCDIFFDAIKRMVSAIFKRLFGWIKIPAILERLLHEIRLSSRCVKANPYGKIKSI
ncbi:MAG: hypothetical protein Q4C84_08320 [Bacillota bacterium]|nr:hypothetical protein [Bacillota bacterium]